MQGGKAPVAQRIEHQTSNLGVARSSRAGRAIKNRNKCLSVSVAGRHGLSCRALLNRLGPKHCRQGVHVSKTILAGSVLAAALLFTGQPAKAEWLCGPDRCVWVTYDVDEPAFALAWGPRSIPAVFGSKAS